MKEFLSVFLLFAVYLLGLAVFVYWPYVFGIFPW